MDSTRLLKKSGLYFIGNFSSKILTALLLPLYAFYISTEDFGYFDYSQTLMNIIMPFIFVAIWESILKFIIAENDDKTKDKILGTSAIFTLTIGIVSIFIICIAVSIMQVKIDYLNYITAMILAHSFAQIWQYYARGLGFNKIFVLSGIVATIINFLSILLLVCYFNTGIVGLYVSYILGQISIVLCIEIKIKIIKKIRLNNFDFKILKRMLLFSTPLVFNLISSWMMSGFGRMMITNYLGTHQNGLYTFANKFSQLVTVLGNVIIMAIIEEAIIATKEDGFEEKFSNVMQRLFYLFQMLIILAIPAISILYIFISKTDYVASLSYVPLLLIYSVCMTMSSNIGSIFQTIDKTKYQFLTTVLEAVATIVFTLSTINIIGVYAVINGQLIGSMVMLISRYILARRYVNIYIKWSTILNLVGLFGVVSFISINSNLIINITIIFIVLGILAWDNKEKIKVVHKLIVRKEQINTNTLN